MRRFWLLLPAMAAAYAALEWPQFGGPNANFQVPAKGLAKAWPNGGPKLLWKRELGEGYSGIAVDGNLLYTMYRSLGEERVLAAHAATGKTVWEYSYRAPFNGDGGRHGPHATPLVTGDRVYTIGVTGHLHAFEKKTGQLAWERDIYGGARGGIPHYGLASSLIAYKHLILAPAGGKGDAVAALAQRDGGILWRKHDFNAAYSTPLLIHVDGQDQVVMVFSRTVAGFDPNNGDLLWTHPHVADYGLNVATPLWGEGNLLFLSSAYNAGTRALQLWRDGKRTVVKELWHSPRVRLHHGNAIRIGGTVYFSSGDFGPAPLTAVDILTGKVLWQDRAFPKAGLVRAGDRLIVLDEDGNLALAAVSPQGLQVISKVHLMDKQCWTTPTLVGNTLFVRDRGSMVGVGL
ncbi:MAG: PQQ-binding-like beta-propeller repeat protein [Acidobacteria bacterium]|nr:PQQ-binding-like beta-propeller repeat protein [Acidobacteriota bacterium]